MPDDPAGARALVVKMGHPVDRGFDGKILLVASDFFNPTVVNNKLVDEFQQALRAEQAVQGSILGSRQPLVGPLQFVKMAADGGGVIAVVVKLVFFGGGEGLVDKGVGGSFQIPKGF